MTQQRRTARRPRLLAKFAQLAELAVCAAFIGGLGGCMTVHIQGDSGQIQTIRHFGLLQVKLADPQQAITGSMTGVGLVSAPLGWSLGYTRQRWTLMGPECRVVAWVAPGGIDEQTRKDLVRAAAACLLEDEDAGSTSIPMNSKSKDEAP